MKTPFFFFTVALAMSWLLISCTSAPQVSSDGLKDAQFRILSMNEREMETEPCGCSMMPRGGMVREESYLKKRPVTEAHLIYVNQGRTFSPGNKDWKKGRVSEYRTKAEFLAKAMKQLKVSFITLDAGDLLLGADHLKSLSALGGFSYLSSDLVSQTGLASPVAKISDAAGTVYLLSLSTPLPPGQTLPAGFKQLPWEDALEAQLKSIPEDSYVVVFAKTNEKRVHDLVARFPKINLVLGSDNPLSLGKLHVLNARSAWMESRPRGQQIADTKIKLIKGSKSTFFIGRSDQVALSREWHRKQIADLKANLLTGKGQDRNRMKTQLKEYEAFLVQTEGVVATPTDGQHLVEGTQTDLTEEWQIKDSPIEKVFKEMKDKVAQNARIGE